MTTTVAKVTARRSWPRASAVSRKTWNTSRRRDWDKGGARVRKRLITVADEGGWGTWEDA